MVTCPVQRHLPLTVNSPPRQLPASVRTQVPPGALPDAGIRLKPEGQTQAPAATVPPSQTMVASGAARVKVSATQRPLSACVLAGQLGVATTAGDGAGAATAGGGGGGATGSATLGGGGGAGGAGGVATGADSGAAGGGGVCCLFTQWPFRKSCQGKQPLSVARFRCGAWALAADQSEKAIQIKNAAVARMRVMHKTPSPSDKRANQSLCYRRCGPGKSK